MIIIAVSPSFKTESNFTFKVIIHGCFKAKIKWCAKKKVSQIHSGMGSEFSELTQAAHLPFLLRNKGCGFVWHFLCL